MVRSYVMVVLYVKKGSPNAEQLSDSIYISHQVAKPSAFSALSRSKSIKQHAGRRSWLI